MKCFLSQVAQGCWPSHWYCVSCESKRGFSARNWTTEGSDSLVVEHGPSSEARRSGDLVENKATNLLLSPFTTVTRIGGSLSLFWVNLWPSHGVWWRRYMMVYKLSSGQLYVIASE